MAEYEEAKMRMYQAYKERVESGDLKEPSPENKNTPEGLEWKQWLKIKSEVEESEDQGS